MSASLSHELAVSLLGNRLVDALRLLELGPQVKVGLCLVMGDGIGIILLLCVCMKDGIRLGFDIMSITHIAIYRIPYTYVNLVKEELVWVVLRSEDVCACE